MRDQWRPQYFVQTNLGGAKLVGFDLTNGRITRLAFYVQSLPVATVRQLIAESKKTCPDDALQTETGARLAGSVKVEGVPVRVLISRQMNSGFEGGAKPGGNGLIEFEIDRAHWNLLYNDVKPEIAKAMKNGKLIPGMTEEQAKIAMGREVWAETDLLNGGKDKRITFWRKEYRAYGGGIGKTASIAGERKNLFLVSVRNGVIEDVITY